MILPFDLNHLVLTFIEASTLQDTIRDVLVWIKDKCQNDPGDRKLKVFLNIAVSNRFPYVDAGPLCKNWEAHVKIQHRRIYETSYNLQPLIEVFWENWDHVRRTITFEDQLTEEFRLISTAPREVTELPPLIAKVAYIKTSFDPKVLKVPEFYQPDYLISARHLAQWLEDTD